MTGGRRTAFWVALLVTAAGALTGWAVLPDGHAPSTLTGRTTNHGAGLTLEPSGQTAVGGEVVASGTTGSTDVQVLGLTITAAAPKVGTPPPTPGSPVPSNPAEAVLQSVHDQLVASYPTGDKATDKGITAAISDLEKSLAGPWSADGNHVAAGPGSNVVFDNAKKAAADLVNIKPPPPPPPGPPPKPHKGPYGVYADYVSDIDYAMWLVASTTISDNSCSPAKPNELTSANKELATGNDEFDKAHFDAAVDHYKNAWDHANKALGGSCAGITNNPTGTLLNVSGVAPGRAIAPQSVIITVTGSAANAVGLTVQNLVARTCSQNGLQCPAGVGTGTLASGLHVNVVDNTTGRTVYDGLLAGLTTAQQVCGAGSTLSTCLSPWSAGEAHSLTLTLSLPSSASDNAYQGTSVTFDFVWTRT